jgi:hypothetical protein
MTVADLLHELSWLPGNLRVLIPEEGMAYTDLNVVGVEQVNGEDHVILGHLRDRS